MACDLQVCNLVRQMLFYAVISGCRYGLLTDLIHLIAFRFSTLDVAQEVCRNHVARLHPFPLLMMHI